MNLPNKLTVMRIVLVPFFVAVLLIPGIPHHYLWAAVLFGAAALTDHYDGKLARKNNQITNFGKFLDPLADKILVISALVCFVDLRLAATWCVLVIIAREFMVTSIRLVAVDSGVVIAANKWGKTKTVSQIIAIIAILLFQYVQELISIGKLSSFTIGGMSSADVFAAAGYVLILIATFFALLSGIIYIVQNIGVINTTK
ncbi:MAG: CDP-diacylglycerol--glycerol-3-phosphate 3-phosphatidyltransferase [Clostridiales bacterium]|jgi:CDP-diacylglycerol---glycerol-3-phosphate 3-phosphatidyltransferase|nr:CDP-diacylglycerol--glycerol-3-phosphate 3-phosphatidyltransferase [Clostridiales bacterium]